MNDAERDEWLDWRRQGIGASDIAAILGISPWASPWSVWADKMRLLPPQPDSGKMEFGRRAEAMIASWFEDETGLDVDFIAGEEIRLQHPDHDWARSSPDGVVYEGIKSATPLGGLEMKTAPAGKRWDEIPAHYQAQGQWQMHTSSKWERVWFAVLHGWRLEIYELERDQADIDMMAERASEFWHDHVLAGVEPEVDGHEATARAIAAVYPDARDRQVELGDRAAGALAELAVAKGEVRAAKAEQDRLTNIVKAAMRDAYEATVGGRRVATLAVQTNDM